jgi:hypothetical protein
MDRDAVALYTEDLLPPREKLLARRGFQPTMSRVVHELVHEIEVGCIFRNTHSCAHAERIDGSTALDERRHPIFVETAARKDLDALEACSVKTGTRGSL